MRGSRWIAIVVLGLLVLFGAAGCRRPEEPPPESGDVEFEEVEEPPVEVAEWVDAMTEHARDWMILDDVVYVAVSREEVPHAGHDVVIERIGFSREDEDYFVDVSATYTGPDPDVQYEEGPMRPVALVRFPLDEIPGATAAVLDFAFLVDEADVVELPEEEHPRHRVILYFGTSDGQMTRVYRTIRAPELDVDLLVAELMAGPVESGAIAVLPEGTTLTVTPDAEQSDLVHVDFSREVLEARGTLGEMLAVYSVVNTLVDNDLGYERVQVSVDGRSDTLGHLDIGDPLTFEDALVLDDK